MSEKFKFTFQSENKFFEANGKRKFSGVAYSGGLIKSHWHWGNLVFDCSSTKAENDTLPILLEHDSLSKAGFGKINTSENKITVDGTISSSTKAGIEVSSLSDEGFPWQMSVYIEPQDIQEIPDGFSVNVNGQDFLGPITIFKNNSIREVSFVAMGADSQTTAKVFNKGKKMDKEIKTEEENKFSCSCQDKKKVETSESSGDGGTDQSSENEELKKKIADLQAKIAELESKEAEMQKQEKMKDVKASFSTVGIELSNEEVEKYLSFSKEDIELLTNKFSNAKPKLDPELAKEKVTQETKTFAKVDKKSGLSLHNAAKDLMAQDTSLTFDKALKQILES